MVGAKVCAVVGAKVGAIVGAKVGAIVGAKVGATVGAKVGATVGAATKPKVGAMVGDDTVCWQDAATKGPGPCFVHTDGFPAKSKSWGSQTADPLFVQGWPPHHTHGWLAILTPWNVAALLPSLDFKHVASSVT